MQDAYSKQIKSILENIINEMSVHPELFAKNPGKDFTRDRKLSFNKLIHLLLGMRGNSISKEIYDYFKNIDEIITSAFIQQRDKLLPEALEFILNEFNNQTQGLFDKETYEDYYLYAIDGTDVNIATNPNSETYCNWMKSATGAKGYNQFHVNALYDVLNKTYKDCIVQPKPKANEYSAAWDMCDRNKFDSKSIIIADRGYASLNLFEHINRKENIDFLIRVKNTWLKEINNLPLEELDINISFELRNTQTNQDKKDYKSGKAKQLAKNSIWDFELPYKMEIRVVRFKISDDAYETIVTSLNKFQFPISKIKELYHLRWGIETSFRELKYAIGLVNFHAKKENFILQEIFARLVIYNFCERITKQIVIRQDDNRKWTYQVNYTMGIHICLDFFRHHSNEPPPDVETLITKYILPIREGRSDLRKLKTKSVVFFLYRVA